MFLDLDSGIDWDAQLDLDMEVEDTSQPVFDDSPPSFSQGQEEPKFVVEQQSELGKSSVDDCYKLENLITSLQMCWHCDLVLPVRWSFAENVSSMPVCIELVSALGSFLSNIFKCVGQPVLQLIQDYAYRNQLLAEIAELQSFLRHRSSELSSTSVFSMSFSGTLSSTEIGKSEIDKMLSKVDFCWRELTSDSLTRLMSLHTSSKFFGRLVNSLQSLASQEAKFYR